MEVNTGQEQQQISRSCPPALGLEPWLVFFHGRRRHNQTFYSLSKDHYQVKNIPEMRRKNIYACSHGWLLLVGVHSDDCFLLNPTTMNKIQLPPLRSLTHSFYCVISLPPHNPNCIVLIIINSRPKFVTLMFCKLGDGQEWIQQELEMVGEEIVHAICFKGKIYGLSVGSGSNALKLVTFDIGSISTIREFGTQVPKSMSHMSYCFGASMVEVEGQLFVIRKLVVRRGDHDEICDFEVYKMDFDKKTWERVLSLGDHAFFLSYYCCTSCSAKGGIKGNTIYFMSHKHPSLYAFNLEERSTVITLPCPNVKNDWHQCGWVMPLS